ncbi:MAG: hypothetical protein WCL32_23280, partial [Planctomycetota bacterium]
MAKESKPPSPFEGRWRITSMKMWSQAVLDAEVEGFVEFGPNGSGSFQFAYVSGDIDYLDSIRDGMPGVEWSWNGNDEMDPASGRFGNSFKMRVWHFHRFPRLLRRSWRSVGILSPRLASSTPSKPGRGGEDVGSTIET